MQRRGNQNKVPLYLPDDVLNAVDQTRGLVPRSTYLKHLISEALNIQVPENNQ